MCGRYVLKSSPSAIRLAFGYAEQPNFPPRYNIAPTQPVPAVICQNGVRHFRLMRWGLIPSWVKDPKKFSLVFNARSESIREKPAFKNAIKRRRCLLPADGYYEWQQSEERKQPLFIHLADDTPFGFAGVHETWTGPNGEEMDTVAIITVAATGELEGLHPRVPVAIAPRNYDIWLNADEGEVEEACELLKAPEQGAFAWHAISSAVNKVANDDPDLLRELTPQEIEAEMASQAVKASPRKSPPAPDAGQGELF